MKDFYTLKILGSSVKGLVAKNPNVTGPAYVANFVPDERKSLSSLIDLTKLVVSFR